MAFKLLYIPQNTIRLGNMVINNSRTRREHEGQNIRGMVSSTQVSEMFHLQLSLVLKDHVTFGD